MTKSCSFALALVLATVGILLFFANNVVHAKVSPMQKQQQLHESLRPNPNLSNGWVKEVTSLPGWGGPLPATTYSGYFDIKAAAPDPTTKMYMHYQMYLSEGNPETDPVIVWWNGGPGATSTWGLFVENGPMLLNDASLKAARELGTDIPQLIRNNYTWSRFATLVAFANPPPIGFSYCDPPGASASPKGSSCGTWNDTRVGVTNAEGLRILFDEHFPKLLSTNNKKLFFAGESYAGVYIGSTLREVVSKPQYSSFYRHLDGVALGDACLGSDVICGRPNFGPYYWLFFLYGHGQISAEMWQDMLTVCTIAELKGTAKLPAACEAKFKAIKTTVGGYNVYNLYDNCPGNLFGSSNHNDVKKKKQKQEQQWASTNTSHPQSLSREVNGYNCPGRVFNIYFDRHDVRQAIGVPLNSTFFNEDDAIGMKYIFNEKNVLPLLASLLKKTKIKIMAYEGDADVSVIEPVAEHIWWQFASNNSFTKSKEWHAWTTDQNIVGGYVTHWDGGKLQFVTVRGSGHMVPEYKPLAARVIFENWVKGSDLPSYVPPGN